jgi:ABC-type Fe3+-siderophore transport system permease subunit
MQVDVDSLSVVLSNLFRTAEMLVAWSNVQLIRFGLDPTTIITRGPSLVLMGLAFSAVLHSLVRVRSFAGERMSLWYDGKIGGTNKRQLVYVASAHGNRER